MIFDSKYLYVSGDGSPRGVFFSSSLSMPSNILSNILKSVLAMSTKVLGNVLHDNFKYTFLVWDLASIDIFEQFLKLLKWICLKLTKSVKRKCLFFY